VDREGGLTLSQHANKKNRHGFTSCVLFLLIAFLLLCEAIQAQDLEHINLNTNGVNSGQGLNPFISSNGRFVVFIDSGLLPSDTNGLQAYLYDRELDLLELVSQTAAGGSADREVSLPANAGAKAVSEDGRYVVFRTLATNLPGIPPGNTYRHIYIRDRVNGTTNLVSRSTAGVAGNQGSTSDFTIASDGWGVLFNSIADNLDLDAVSDNFTNTYLHDLSNLDNITTKMACYDEEGAKVNACTGISLACAGAMAFISSIDDVAPDDLNLGRTDVFYGIPLNGTNVIISVGPGFPIANDTAFSAPAISCNGQRIAFSTKAKLSAADDDVIVDWDLYVHDISTGISALIRGPSSTSFRATRVAMSPNGEWIAFATAAKLDPVDTNNFIDIYAVRYTSDRVLGTVRLVSQKNGVMGNGPSNLLAISNQGVVAFESGATNFAEGVDDNGGGSDIFVNGYNLMLRDGFEAPPPP